MIKKIRAIILLFFFLALNPFAYAGDFLFPDYANEYLGPDKHENFNRKMFRFNEGLNKFLIRPIHIIWASILPQWAMDRLYGISHNLEYPIRLVSTLVQRDFHNSGVETKRFLINTTIGLAGMFDPARHILKVGRGRDNMDKAFSRCNIKPGPYFVAPVIVFTTVRGLFGRLFDAALNPTMYIGTPALAIIKAGLTINRTSYLQSVIELVESNYADPYDITKKAFGIDSYMKKRNYDRVEIFDDLVAKNSVSDNKNIDDIKDIKANETLLNVEAKLADEEISPDNEELEQDTVYLNNVSANTDIHLENYFPQAPVVDSMRTSLFILPDANKSIWNDLSIWNRSFAKRIKTSSVSIVEGRKDYTFKYILQKDKNAPLAVLYPSTGDGVKASHPVMFAKLFYDEGYSVVIHGNPFQWEYVQSMPEDYRPGLPSKDAFMMRISTKKIIEKLEKKYKRNFKNKVILGTSLAGIDVLFMAEQEEKENTLGASQFIAICPPVDLLYSIKIVDSIAEEWLKEPDKIKDKMAYAAAKIYKFYQLKSEKADFPITAMPFNEEEAKLITSFLMHQKLSDVIFTLENTPKNKKNNIYSYIYRTGFEEYMNKYILSDDEDINKEINKDFGIISISDYLKTSDNYKIYHTTNDYLINKNQLKMLKYLAGDKLTIMDNGSHMGFLYRKEFISDFKNTIVKMKPSL